MSRTHRLKAPMALAAVAAVLTTAACGGGSGSGASDKADGADSKTLVVSTFPFGVEEFEKAVVVPFEKQTGIQVELDKGSNADRISKLEMNAKRSDIDVMLISDYYAALGQSKKLFQPVDEGKVPSLKEIAPFAKDAQFQGPGYSYQLNGILYRTDKLTAQKAATWEVFADPTLKGKTAQPDISVTAGQLTVSGVGQVYGSGPYDVDTAFKKIASWKPQTLQFYRASTEVTNLLTQGEITAAPAINGFATKLVKDGAPIAWVAPAKGRFMATNRAMIPAGAPNAEGAHEFIDFLLSATTQTAAADQVGDLPVNPRATVPQILGTVAGPAAKDPVAAGYQTLDMKVVVENRKAWVDRFTREVAGK